MCYVFRDYNKILEEEGTLFKLLERKIIRKNHTQQKIARKFRNNSKA